MWVGFNYALSCFDILVLIHEFEHIMLLVSVRLLVQLLTAVIIIYGRVIPTTDRRTNFGLLESPVWPTDQSAGSPEMCYNGPMIPSHPVPHNHSGTLKQPASQNYWAGTSGLL